MPRKIRVEQVDSPYFTVQGWKTLGLQSDKVAPGMEVQYIVKFTPDENVDYIYELVCVTEREKFVVPIKAIGARGYLDFPDQVVFSDCPVRYESTRILLVRNVGDAPAKFDIASDGPFSATPSSGVLEAGKSTQFKLSFYPKTTGSFTSSLLVNYQSGETMQVELTGSAENVNVRLEKSSVRIQNTITLTAKKTVKLSNRSDILVKYSWMRCSNEMEEELLRSKQTMEYRMQEQEELALAKAKGKSPLDLSLIKRKYVNKHLEQEAVDYAFSDKVFRIEPDSGVLWPGSSVDVSVYFRPALVGDHSTIAYCEIEGRESRLPLQLKGTAMGPKVNFSYSTFNIGQVFINTLHRYEVLIENTGQIKSRFTQLESESFFGPKFKFIPSSGVVNVGEQLRVEVVFQPDLLGNFHEEFFWELEVTARATNTDRQGGAERLKISFIGDVVGPTFEFDTPRLCLPTSSYGFSTLAHFHLNNTSLIPMNYRLDILNTDGDKMPDFTVTPASGVIAEQSSAPLSLEFLPTKIDTFSGFVVVHVDGVGENLLRIPVEATSIVPEISLLHNQIDIHECYLDYPYRHSFVLVNNTEFCASFAVQKESSRNNAYVYSFDSAGGVIQPYSQLQVEFSINIKQIGPISIPIFVNIIGSSSPPLSLEIRGLGIGPTVGISARELNWGSMAVLQSVSQGLKLANNSPIAANFTCSKLGDAEVFTVSPLNGVIQPGASVDITVAAYLDDTIKFTEVLKIAIASSDAHEVPLIARGQGSTIVFDDALRLINFDDVFSNRECSISFTMTNRGRRTQHLSWGHVSSKDPVVLSNQIFEVVPQRFTLKPKAYQTIFLKARSNVATRIHDKLLCYSNTDKEPTRKLLVESTLSVNFVNPLVEIFPESLNFQSIHTSDNSFEVLHQPLTLKNTTTLALTVNLKCPLPFSISDKDASIQLSPGAESVVSVAFDPAHNFKRISVKETGKLLLSYLEHPQKDAIALNSELYFPNLTFEKNALEFGCIQNQVEQMQSFVVTNTSTLPVMYQWYFAQNSQTEHQTLCQAFDIRPLHGKILPGRSQDISVTFFGHPNENFQTKAICDVSGGPKYELHLQGQASAIQYSIDCCDINFDTVSYQSMLDRELWIENKGSVAFNFQILLGRESSLYDKIMVTPSAGTIVQNARQRLLVRLCPGVPDDIDDTFHIQIGDFEPEVVRVSAKTVFPMLRFDFPENPSIAAKPEADAAPSEDAAIAYEQYRLLLKEKTAQQLVPYREEAAQVCKDAKFAGSPLLFQKGQQPKAGKKSLSLSEASSVLFSGYSFDFGTVVRNSTVKKTFFITNAGLQSLSFSLIKSNLGNSGFSIEPDRVKNLPPGEQQEFSVSFVARTESNTSNVLLPIFVTGGPVINLSLSASLAVPELRINDDNSIDFGELFHGFRKSTIVSIENISAVRCEWSFQSYAVEMLSKKKSYASESLKDFQVIPSTGLLLPFEKATIQILFSPTLNQVYDTTLPFKISMNSKVYQVQILGSGCAPSLVFDPPSLALGPILPFGDGAECKVTMYNPTSMPVEVFSTNFDTQYRQDEDSLRQLEFDNGFAYLPPRDMETSFSEYLAEILKTKNEDKKDLEGKPMVAELVGTTDQSKVSIALATNESILAPDVAANVIIHGPPLSGRTTQARKIESVYGKTFINFDTIIERSPQFAEIGDKRPFLSEKRDLDDDAELKSWDDCKTLFSEDTVFEIVRNFFQNEENHAPRGYVLDSLECKYCSNMFILLRLVSRLFLDRCRKLYVFHFTLELAKVKEREASIIAQQIEKKLSALKVKELGEDEYDALAQPDKDQYDAAMQKYKKKLKEIEEKRHKERRVQEDDVPGKAGSHKADDGKSKRRGHHSRAPTTDKAEKTGPVQKDRQLKKPGSPKMARKTVDKHSEKEKIDKEPVEDGSPEEVFSNELTIRRVDTYLATQEVCLSIFKEGKEGDRTRGNGMNSDKKKGTKQAEQEKPLILIDLDSHVGEDAPLPEFHEINSSGMEEDAVFKAVGDIVPLPPKEESVKVNVLNVCEIVAEQIFSVPADRPKTNAQKLFSILAGYSADSENDGHHAAAEGTPLTAPSVAKPPEQNKTEAKKVTKGSAKVTEDRVELEEEPEKELPMQTRWILQGGERKDIIIRYNPVEATKSDIVFNFEVVGWSQQFHLPCSGFCQHSQVSTDFKKMFEKTRKTKEEKEIVRGEFLLASGTYEFGPLLHNKPRDKYLERFPENKVNITFSNPGATEIKVFFGLKADIKQETFFFDPPSLSLLPGQSSPVSVWAYPKSATQFEDTFVVSVKDNPEPFVFKLSCSGVKPELEVDRKAITFDKLLVGRSDRRELKLKNPTSLPVYWKLAGVDALGEEFTISPMEGVISSGKEAVVTAEFRGVKAYVTKRILKLEVSDADKISGIVQEIPIVVTAEAYDISMDIHFPKGFDGGLDFGTLKVSDEGKQLVTLKNKGKYEVGFRFLFDSSHFVDLLTITPAQGIIQPSEKPFFVQIVFKTNTEMTLKDYTVLKCIVFEPATGEVTASIPVKVSARAVFSKFVVLPARDLNFGALVYGTKSSKQFTLENSGEFDFKYSLFKLVPQDSKKRLSLKGKTGRPASPPPVQKVKKEVTKQADTISFGAFTVFPTSGVVLAGTKQAITVDFHADTPGSFEESIGFDVTDRSPLYYNDGMEYQLLGESCVPGINTTDFASIFEEQSVCKRLELFKTQNNVYAEDDRAFFFGAYLAGQQVQVHFKISNPFKVGCEVAVTAKPRGKSKSEVSDFAFDVEPKKLTIPSHEHRYVTVMFHPTSIQTYSGVFEACVENVQEGKHKMLSFELRGEGTLPRVTIEKPTLKAKNGSPLIKFRRLMVGTFQTLSLLLKNDGIIPAKMKLEWLYKDNDDFFCNLLNDYQTLKPGETRSIDIRCQPTSIRKLEGELRLKVLDNTFEDSSIFVVGEGYMDDVTMEGFSDDTENELVFGDCFVGETRTLTFKLKNNSAEHIRASFPESPDFVFSPSTMHIRGKGGEKDISVSFAPKGPCDIQKFSGVVKVSKVRFPGSVPDTDWDDRMKIVKWGPADTAKNAQKKVVEAVHEPATEAVAQLADLQIVLSGFADYCSYECDVSRIQFKSTLMFQSRVFRLPIRNTGKVTIKFDSAVFDDEALQIENTNSSFSVTPDSGKIAPGEVVMLAVRFSPNDVGDYGGFIHLNMPNLAKDTAPLVIPVSGFSLRPFCHFELEDTDPLSIEARTPERSLENGVPIVLEPNTKIIEFKSCGIRQKNVKKFYIVNPTLHSYDYVWRHESVSDSKAFKCLTPKGTVASNKKSEIVFEFTPESLDTKESLWSFIIPDHDVRVTFLLIGYATEPSVYIGQSGVNFKSVLVGRQAKEVVQMVNDETTPFAFSFENLVEMGNEGEPVLTIHPMSGVVPAKGELPVEILFSPPTEKLFNFNLNCNVRKKPSPITVNVKGEGYKIHESVLVEMPDGTNYELGADSDVPNIIDFGMVQINDRRVKRIVINNSGKYNFDFSWKSGRKGGPVSISPELGTVLKGDKVVCDLIYSPTNPGSTKDHKLSCQILNGKLFSLSVMGTGSKPLVKLNVPSMQFGTQFLSRTGMPPIVQNLEITNNDVSEMAVDAIFPEVPWLELPRGIYNLAAGETKSIPITFYPRDPTTYYELLKLEINGLTTIDVPISGEGSEFKIEAETQSVNFGALRIGQTSFKSVKIYNKSKIPVPLQLGNASTLSGLNSMGLAISAWQDVVLKPKSSYCLDMRFQPHRRISAFSEDIMFEFFGNSKQLFTLTGACQGTEVKLENDTLPFGAVVQKSLTTRKIQLQNIGDIGAKFAWDAHKITSNFSISPMEGYISPGMEIPMEITFHPNELNPDIRAENIPCRIEGSPTLFLTLSGMCVPQPNHADVIKFSTAVRTVESKSLTLHNKTNFHWHIRPIIDNDSWSGPDTVDVEPGQSKPYDIVFNPLDSNGSGEGRHEGSIFFPLPDGNGILYRLHGIVDKPLPVGNINREIPCKTTYTEILQVSNWMRRPQKFRVITELSKPDPSVIVRGHDFIEISPLQKKDYKFTFYSYKEGTTNFKVIFKNETTQEYLYYNLAYKSTPPGVMANMDITAPIRVLQTRDVIIANPLPTPVVFTGASNNPEVTVPHSITVQPKSEGVFTVEFLPLQPKESTARLVLNSQELGTYLYDAKLTALPSGAERSMHFKVGLGNQQVQTFRFISYCKTK
ncbi:hypothetical protein HDV03_001884, partial [Kappamyces sp. JEL0829]